MTEWPRPVPLMDTHSEVYWDAVRQRRLLIQRCAMCGRYQFYPRQHCVHCFAADPVWVQATGKGRLHTFSTVWRTANPEFAADCPYTVGIVELDEGVRVSARIIGTDPDALACDQRVEVVFTAITDHITLPNFTCAEE